MFEEFRERQHAANLSTHTFEPLRRFNSIYYNDNDDDDDDVEERTIPLLDIISQLPLSIVITTSPLVLPIEDLKDSLIMGNEDLNTIPEKESDEFIKSSVDVELLLHHDPSTLMMSVAFILEGCTDEPPLEENDDLFDLDSKENKWKKILYDASIDDLMTEDKIFDPGIHEKSFSPTYVILPFTDRRYLFFTYVMI
nr:hypothetical protein [Tanacetum cinerariifolium]